MTDLQLELTKLIGAKKLSFGCYLQENNHWSNSDEPVIGRINGYQMGFNAPYMGTYSTTIFGTSVLNEVDEQGRKKWEIIGHPATLEDLQRWIISKFRYGFRQEHSDYLKHIIIRILDNSVVRMDNSHQKAIKYDSTKDLLDQPEETLQEIVSFIKANQ